MKPITQHKDLLELKFWLTCDREAERAKSAEYLRLFDLDMQRPPCFGRPPCAILEIGTGPDFGLLPFFHANRKVAVDPLLDAYYHAGILADRGEIFCVDEPFESWDPGEECFDVIFCANVLDHGQLGFHLLPKLAALLKSGGRLYTHTHLRPKSDLNLIHDHSLSLVQLHHALSWTPFLKEIKRQYHERDFDPPNCPSITGVWEAA